MDLESPVPAWTKSEGFGLRNMRTRASQIDGKLDIHTAAGHGTSIVLTVPISDHRLVWISPRLLAMAIASVRPIASSFVRIDFT